MAKVRATKSSEPKKKTRPALTPEARENQLIAKAVDLAEKQIEEGTASSQVITHYLKLGSTKEKLEREAAEKASEAKKEEKASLVEKPVLKDDDSDRKE